MELSIDTCTKINFRGSDRKFNNMDQELEHSMTWKDLHIQVWDNLTWKIHIEDRLRKSNKVQYILHRNVAVKTQTTVNSKTTVVQVSHLVSAVVWFLMRLRIKSRSPLTRKIWEESSEMDNREWNNELSKPTENPERPAVINVSTV